MRECVTYQRYNFSVKRKDSIIEEYYPTLSYVASAVVSCVEGHASRIAQSRNSDQYSVVVQDALYGLAKLPLALFRGNKCLMTEVDEAHTYIPDACQPAYVDQFEQKFGVDVNLQWGAATAADFQQLASALLLVSQARPQDVGLIHALEINNEPPTCFPMGRTRTTSPHTIWLHNLFVRHREGCATENIIKKVPGFLDNYTTYLRGQDYSYMFFHELGHLVGMRENEKDCLKSHKGEFTGFVCSASRGTVPYDYEALGSSETFAEDYRIYCASNGREVMYSNRRGDVIPHYEDRLRYMKSHFTLATTPDGQTPMNADISPFTCADAS